MIINGNKVFEDNASKPDLDIFRRIRKLHRLEIAESMGLTSAIKIAVKHKSEPDISEILSFIVDEWKEAKREEEINKNKKI